MQASNRKDSPKDVRSNSPEHFEEESKLDEKTATGAFSHETSIVKRKKPSDLTGDIPKKYLYLWYMKKEGNPATAVREVVAQEFFRLLIPSHTKTRLVRISKNSQHYIISKQIPGFVSLSKMSYAELSQKIKDGLNKKTGGLTGLADVVVMSLLLNEADLKLANIGVDNQGRIIKIDGDWCFAGLSRSDLNNTITEQHIRNLPFGNNLSAYNWFDQVIAGKVKRSSEIFDDEIQNHPAFKLEMNNALLRALLISNELANTFVDSYVEDETQAKQLTDEFIKRRDQLEKSALENANFQNYLLTDEAKQEVEKYFQYLTKFRTMGTNYLLSKSSNTEQLIQKKFQDLQTSVKNLKLDENQIELLTRKLADPKTTFAELKTLLEGKLNKINNDGKTLLHYFSQYNRTDLIAEGLKENLDPNKKDINNKTAFDIAMEATNHGCAVLFFDDSRFDRKGISKASLLTPDSSGKTILHVAVEKKIDSAFHYLINNDKLINQADQLGRTPLHCAIERGDMNYAKQLLKNDADPFLPDKEGYTPIDYAIELGYINEFKDLFDPKILIDACEQNNLKNVKKLLEIKVNPNAKNEEGTTALYMATDYLNVDIIKELLKHGAQFLKDNNGDYPIHVLLGEKENPGDSKVEKEIIKLFFEAKADLSVTLDETGGNIFHMMSAMHFNELFKFVMEFKQSYDLNFQDYDGNTIAHVAAQYDNQEMLLMLAKQQVNFGLVDAQNRTPIDEIMNEHQWTTLANILTILEKNPLEPKKLTLTQLETIVGAFIEHINTLANKEEQMQLLNKVLNKENALGELLNSYSYTPQLFQTAKPTNQLVRVRELHTKLSTAEAVDEKKNLPPSPTSGPIG